MIDYALGDKPTLLAALDAEMRAALGDRITGLTHDADGVRLHFVSAPTAEEQATADAVFAAHAPQVEPPAPSPAELLAQIDFAAMENELAAAQTLADARPILANALAALAVLAQAATGGSK